MHNLLSRCFAAALIIPAISISTRAEAGSVTSASIIRTYAYNGSSTPTLFFVAVSTNDSNIGCNGSNLPLFVVDVSTVGGRAQAAAILSAQASGQTVSIVGSGSCNLSPNVESAVVVSIP